MSLGGFMLERCRPNYARSSFGRASPFYPASSPLACKEAPLMLSTLIPGIVVCAASAKRAAVVELPPGVPGSHPEGALLQGCVRSRWNQRACDVPCGEYPAGIIARLQHSSQYCLRFMTRGRRPLPPRCVSMACARCEGHLMHSQNT